MTRNGANPCNISNQAQTSQETPKNEPRRETRTQKENQQTRKRQKEQPQAHEEGRTPKPQGVAELARVGGMRNKKSHTKNDGGDGLGVGQGLLQCLGSCYPKTVANLTSIKL